VSRRFAVLVNPAAAGGRSLERLPATVGELERLGAPHRIVETRDPDHARAEASAAVERGETVAALGGDGMLRPLAEVLRGTDASLAILPAGRGNDLARVLGIPGDPAAAVRVAVEGGERMLDVASVDGTSYLGIASFGFDSDANRIANEARLIRGNVVYLYAALRALAGWRPARFEIVVDGERHALEGYSIAVANSQAYGGGMFIAPQAQLDDGRLDVVATGRSSKLRFLRVLPQVFKGDHLSDPSVSTFTGTTIELAADRPFTIYADGDPIAELPATVRVEARCLRVVVPRS
jgi:YegS/Rv2252/BmrU family lipid kinase